MDAYDLRNLRDNLIQINAWIRHWRLDAESNLTPTPSSLDNAAYFVRDSLKTLERAPIEANARLVDAAPDMLAALKSWLEEVDGTYPFESLEPTRAAIAKADDLAIPGERP